MNIWTIAGMITGIIISIAVVAVLFRFVKKDKKQKFNYDERQIAQRGQAYKYAFFTLVGYNALYGIIDMILEKPWAEDLTGLMIGVCLAVVVHVAYSIWHECYFSMNEEPSKVIGMFAILVLCNGYIAYGQARDGELIQNGMLTNSCANLVVAVALCIIMIVLAAKWQAKKREESEEE